MIIHQDPTSRFEELRKEAEALIARQPGSDSKKSTDILELIHELRIHEVELEIQNEELKQAQQELSDLHRKYEDLYEFAPCGYLVLNDKGIITQANLTSVRLLGVEKQLLFRSGFAQMIMPGWEDTFLKARQTAGETGKKQSIEIPLKRKTGSPSWFRTEIAADCDSTGAVISWRMVLLDITDKKAAEAALADNEKRFRELYEQAPVAYQSLDDMGNFITVNETWLSVLGYSKTDVLGKNFSEFLNPEWKDHFRQNFPRFKTVGEVLGVEFEMRKKDGTNILVSFHGRIARNVKREFRQTHCVFYDITAQRKMETDKKRLEGQLRQSQKMESIGTLAGGVAHEINNVLYIIIGNTEVVMDEIPEQSPVRENLEDIREASFRARDVVRQLLTFSRHDDAEKKPLSVGLVAKESIKLIRSSIPANIAINQDIASDAAPILANATQINQVLINLCSNAADAIEKTGGAISIGVGNASLDEGTAAAPGVLNPGQYVKVTVSDNGCGMDQKTLERIFEPYFTTKKIGKGTGIGLAVVHGIVKHHGGFISVQSTPDEGTVFTLLFPACKEVVLQEHEEETALPSGNEQILLVDDEPSLLKLNKQRLQMLGYAVSSTTDPVKALEMFKSDPASFDLVITDMAMPQMTGVQLASGIRKIRPKMPVMLCTGYSENISQETARDIGICAFVMKPLDRTDFAVTVRKTLDAVKTTFQ